MWHLEIASDKTLAEYTNLILKQIEDRIKDRRNNPHYKAWCDYLLPVNRDLKFEESILKKIITSEPDELFKLNHKIINLLLRKHPKGNKVTYDEKQLLGYIKEKRKKPGNADKQIIDKYDDLFKFLHDVFDYSIIKGKKAYQIALMKRVNTCTYCNRQYTLTIGVEEEESGEKKSKVKPQFDHWFAHEQYPLLGVSYYNLIPSCSVCNSAVKGSAHFTLNTHIHPYTTKNSNPDFTFMPILKYDEEMKKVRWGIKLKRKEGSKEDNTIKDLFLEEVYDQHGEMEVKDIMDFATKNNPTYLKTLFHNICDELKKDYTQAEVYRMLFGVDADVEKTLDRPFSKLKRDILKGEGIFV